MSGAASCSVMREGPASFSLLRYFASAHQGKVGDLHPV